jgi:hypothetical protein
MLFFILFQGCCHQNPASYILVFIFGTITRFSRPYVGFVAQKKEHPHGEISATGASSEAVWGRDVYTQ